MDILTEIVNLWMLYENIIYVEFNIYTHIYALCVICTVWGFLLFTLFFASAKVSQGDCSRDIYGNSL